MGYFYGNTIRFRENDNMMIKEKNYFNSILDSIDDVINEFSSNLFPYQNGWSFSDDKKEDDTSIILKSFTSTMEGIDIPYSFIERRVRKLNAENEKNEINALVDSLVSKLEKSLEIFEFDSGSLSSVEKDVIAIEKEYNMRILGNVLQTIYYKHFDKPMYLVGICSALLRYDLDEVKPWGIIMLSGLLNHPDERVKEATIELIDNWSDVELLPLLKTLEVSSKWMRDYIERIVHNLESIDVLH